MSDRLAREAVRERDERDARFFAWDVPGDAHIVALVHEADEAERSATVADAIATSVARRREHTLLLCAAAGPSPLDELLGGAGSPGLPAALEGRARLTDVAVQRVDRPFVYLPAGRDPVAMRALLGDDLLTSFIERVRERGGTLFIVLSEETLRADGLVSLLDGYVALGDVALPEAIESLPQFGRVRFEDPDEAGRSLTERGRAPAVVLPELPADTPRAAPAGAGDGPDAEGSRDAERTDPSAVQGRPPATPWRRPDEAVFALAGDSDVEVGAGAGDGAAADHAAAAGDAPAADHAPAAGGAAVPWTRHRKTPGFPVARIAFGTAVIAAVSVVWWLIARAADTPGAGGSAGAEAAQTTADAGAGEPPAVFDAAAASRAFEAAPALGYSVLIASYADRADAEERLGLLRSRSEGFFFLSPTPVRGVVYHRVFAGALPGRDEGVALMDALVDARLKDEAGDWDVRPAGLAFDLGLFARRDEAEARVRVLGERSIPAYAIGAAGSSDAPWRVYGGAFESERAAGPLAEILDDAGEPAALVERRGVDPAPPSNE